MRKTITLKEYEFLQCENEKENNYINKRTFNALEQFVLKNETTQYLKITTKKGYKKILQAQNYVGIIQTKDGIIIEILPKISNVKYEELKKIVLKMLKTLKNSPFKNFNMAYLKKCKMPLFEIFISMFLDELSYLLKKGIKSDYIQKEDNLKFLKGKLNINKQIQKNFIHKERFYVEYDEFMRDRVENRLIKTTLYYLYKKSRSNKNQKRIREFLFIFDDVGLSNNIKADFKKVNLNRQMKDYKQLLLWSKIFLLGNSFSPYRGNDVAFALLFDMNLLFESYVGEYLKKHLKKHSFDVKLQDKSKYLVEEPKAFMLKPDIIINKDKEDMIIADTKWKILSKEKLNYGISQADMYQLYAYGTKYNCKKLFLIYPKEEVKKEECYKFFTGANEVSLKVLFFDLVNEENNKFCDNFIKKC